MNIFKFFTNIINFLRKLINLQPIYYFIQSSVQKHSKLYAAMFSALGTTIISFIIRLLLIKYGNWDVLEIDIHPALSFFFLYNANIARTALRESFLYFVEQPILMSSMNINDILNTPSPGSANNTPSPGPANNAPGPANNAPNPANNVPNHNALWQEQGFRPLENNNYSNRFQVHNPFNIGNFFLPNGQPNISIEARRLAGRIARSMQWESTQSNMSTISPQPRFDNLSNQWLRGFMQHHYPNRHPSRYMNSPAIRQKLLNFSEGR